MRFRASRAHQNFDKSRRLLALLSIAALVTGATTSCGLGSSARNIPRDMVSVVIQGNPLGNPDSFYKPATIHIHPGQTVVWIDRDNSAHTVSPDFTYSGWSGGSGILHPGQRYGFRFTEPHTYHYHCTVHPNMFGTVIVTR